MIVACTAAHVVTVDARNLTIAMWTKDGNSLQHLHSWKTGRLGTIRSFAVGPLLTSKRVLLGNAQSTLFGSSASEGGQVRIYDLGRRKILWTPLVNEMSLKQVAISPDGRYLAACGWQGVHLFDLFTMEHVMTTKVGHNSKVRSAVFDHAMIGEEGFRIVTTSDDHTVRVLDSQIGGNGKRVLLSGTAATQVLAGACFARRGSSSTILVCSMCAKRKVVAVGAYDAITGVKKAERIFEKTQVVGEVKCARGYIAFLADTASHEEQIAVTTCWADERDVQTCSRKMNCSYASRIVDIFATSHSKLRQQTLESLRLLGRFPVEIWMLILTQSREDGERIAIVDENTLIDLDCRSLDVINTFSRWSEQKFL